MRASVMRPLPFWHPWMTCSTNLDPIRGFMDFNLAPLRVRRDIAMLGVIHRSVLRQGPRALQQLFQLGEPPMRIGGRVWHSRYVYDPYSNHMQDYLARSLVGYTWVYNLLPERVAGQNTVREFQKACQGIVRLRIFTGDSKDTLSPRVARHSHPARFML